MKITKKSIPILALIFSVPLFSISVFAYEFESHIPLSPPLPKPQDVTFDSLGNIFVIVEHGVKKLNTEVIPRLGFGSFGDGDGQFNTPWQIAIDRLDNVYVSDSRNHGIEKFVLEECEIPISGDLIITENCRLQANTFAPSNVIIQNGATMTIPDGVTLNVDIMNHYLSIESGSGILVRSDSSLKFSASVYSSENPLVNPPQNILSVTVGKDLTRKISDLGTATATDNVTPLEEIVITNNSTLNGTYPIGTTTIKWTALDGDGNKGIAYQFVTVIENPLEKETDQNNRIVMLNFYDGYSSIFEYGFPIFSKHNIKTTQFIICGNPETKKPNYMSWQEILKLRQFGHDIQSHSMDHKNANELSKLELENQYGKNSISCFKKNGIFDITVVALPFAQGWDNIDVIKTVEKTYEFTGGSITNNVVSLRCSYAGADQKNCETYTSKEQNELNVFHRYNIPVFSHDSHLRESGNDEAVMFSKFIEYVNKANSNTSTEILEVPILSYHRVVMDNSDPDPINQGTTVTLLDAEMKYLRDNNFLIYTVKDFGYDITNNRLTLPSR